MKSFAVLSLLGLAVAAPASDVQKRDYVDIPIKPLSQYTVWTGAVTYNTGVGRIFKSGRTSDITTLGTFTIPQSLAGRKCEFRFDISGGASSKVSGSGTFDVFTSQKPATTTTTTWPHGNLRDQYVGRVKVDANSKVGAFVDGFSPAEAKSFPCVPGEWAGELVGVNDQVEIAWKSGEVKGAYFRAY